EDESVDPEPSVRRPVGADPPPAQVPDDQLIAQVLAVWIVEEHSVKDDYKGLFYLEIQSEEVSASPPDEPARLLRGLHAAGGPRLPRRAPVRGQAAGAGGAAVVAARRPDPGGVRGRLAGRQAAVRPGRPRRGGRRHRLAARRQDHRRGADR